MAISLDNQNSMTKPIAILVAAVFGHLYVLWIHTSRMLSTEHYSFFPIGIIGAIILWRECRNTIAVEAARPKSMVALPLLASSVAGALFSSLLGSGFLGWLSFMLFVVGFIYVIYGGAGLWNLLSVIVMLAVLTPLPALLDHKLILSMQHIASWLASVGLDVFGIIHIRQGVVLVSAKQSFLAEEACSGVRSLFSTIAGIVFWGLLHHYRLWRHLLNLVLAVGWVLVFNSLRIFLVVLIEDQTDFSVASGWKHDALGFVVFFFIGATVLSTDRLIRAFFPLVILDADSTDVEVKPAIQPRAWSLPDSINLNPRFLVPIVVSFALVGILGLRLYTMSPRVASLIESLPPASRATLPESINNWTVKSFREVSRSRGDLQGEKSSVWEMTSGDKQILLSIDGDWIDYHDLGECYSGLGWEVDREFMYPSLKQLASGEQNSSIAECTRLRLEKRTGEQALGYFSVIDRRGMIVLPQAYFGNETAVYVKEKMMNQLRAAVGLSVTPLLRETTFSPPCSTVQMLYFAKDPIDDIMEDDLLRLFQSLRERVKQSKRFGGEL